MAFVRIQRAITGPFVLVAGCRLLFARPFSSIISTMSLVRQNFHEECEAGINRQINMELYASYLYLAMSQHFDRDDVALPGFRKFFAKASEEEREHATKVN